MTAARARRLAPLLAAGVGLALAACRPERWGETPAEAAGRQTATARVGLLTSGSVRRDEPTPASVPTPSGRLTCPNGAWWTAAIRHLGQTTTYQGTVAGLRERPGEPPVLDVGRAYPDLEGLFVRLHDPAARVDGRWVGRSVCVTGAVELQDGYLQVNVRDAADVWLADEAPPR